MWFTGSPSEVVQLSETYCFWVVEEMAVISETEEEGRVIGSVDCPERADTESMKKSNPVVKLFLIIFLTRMKVV